MASEQARRLCLRQLLLGRPPHSAFEFCENGAKATAWEITDERCPPAFFAEHTVNELEKLGPISNWRKLAPDRADALGCGERQIVPISWADAFAAIGAALKALAPKSVVFYTSAAPR